jgi:hypothetical protein
MRKFAIAALAAAFLAALTFSATVYAASQYSSGPMMGGGMMGRSMMGAGGMMSRMSRMMDGCNAVMQGGSHSNRPNDQWRDERSTPDRDR